MLYRISGIWGEVKAETIEGIYKVLSQFGWWGREFTIFSECPEMGTYALFDGKYRKVVTNEQSTNDNHSQCNTGP